MRAISLTRLAGQLVGALLTPVCNCAEQCIKLQHSKNKLDIDEMSENVMFREITMKCFHRV